MKMIILSSDVWSMVTQPRQHLKELALIREVCKARPSGYQFMPAFKSARWDGYISLMRGFSQFPTGLLTRVTDVLTYNNVEHEIVYQGERPKYNQINDNSLEGITLRDYQLEAVQSLLASGRGVAKMATNAGKTEIMSALLRAIHSKSIIITHRKEILYQTIQRFKDRLGLPEIGIIGDGQHYYHFITVAMIQSLPQAIAQNPDYFKDIKVVMVDECHHVSSTQMMDVLQHIPGLYRYGFSGTPLKDDVLADLKLIAMTGEIVCTVTNKYMVKHGWSAKPIVIMHVVEDLDTDVWKLTYADAYSKCIVNNDLRNKIIADVVKGSSGVVLVMVNRIEHGNKLLALLPGAILVQGNDSTDYRQDVITKMRDSKDGIFIATPIYDEGVDIPSIDVLVLAGGDKSNVKTLQRFGRGMRKKEDRVNVLMVHDFLDDTNKYLLNHTKHRLELYKDEGFSVQLLD